MVVSTQKDEHRERLNIQSGLLGECSQVAKQEPEPNLKELFPEVIAHSSAMLNVLATVCKVAKASSSVLILGDSGTGKELIAAAIHRLSYRSRHAYVAINCSAIPEELLEAELFGHEKGAFTGADRKRLGYFGIANHGSIFLDEIGDMPSRLQAKLLRVLQEKKYSPVGSSQTKDIDVRIIAATNVDLEEAVRNNSFRLDLYYRLNVLPIMIPPLEERPEDIPPLLEHFLQHANHAHTPSESCWLDDNVIRHLSICAWPGNVRQLQNLIERLVILKGGGRIGIDDLPPEFRVRRVKDASNFASVPQRDYVASAKQEHVNSTETLNQEHLPDQGIDLSDTIAKIENFYICEALRKTGNNKNQAARLLGLNRTTLVERIKKRRICIK